jgi:hypothetical protein
MKKIITSIASLLLFAGISNAAETTGTETSKVASNTTAAAASSSVVSSKSLAQIIEENSELRLKVEEMTNQAEDLHSELDYSKMMHATISNLKDEALDEQKENTKNQLDYARMMNATLVNLNTVLLLNER